MKFIPVCLCVLAVASVARAQYPGAAPIPQKYQKGIAAVSVEIARANLTYLSVDCEGRGTGQPGYQKAAEFMAAKFKEAGLKPVGDNGTYFQNVPFYRNGIDPAQSYLATEDGSTKVIGESNLSFGRLGSDADRTAPVVFLRANGSSARLKTTEGLDGKIVILASNGESAELARQVRAAPTAAVITVRDKVSPAAAGGVSRRPGGRGNTSLNFMSITRSAAERLCRTLMEDTSPLDPSKAPDGAAELIEAKSSLQIRAKVRSEEVKVPNVVALLEGSDPKLKAEIVGIGAHLDHLGWSGETLFPGADDDGSGSAALLEIARAIKAGSVKPKRSILFMAFCGEEMGLIGSSYYSENPIFPHANMIAELQMDMVGRDSDGIQNGDPKRVDKKEENVDTMRLVGSKRISTDLHNLIEEMNRHIKFRFKWDAEDVYERSDHYNFARKGIPIAFLFDGFHPDYHRPTDTVDKINFEKLTNAAKLYYMVALELANRPMKPRRDVPQTGG